jgi:hypothetical protein
MRPSTAYVTLAILALAGLHAAEAVPPKAVTEDGMTQPPHGFHCRPLWGLTRFGWRWHNHPAACDMDDFSKDRFKESVLPHISPDWDDSHDRR